MTIEGELTVRLDWDGRRVRKATVRSTRPFAAARVLVGRASADAARTAPRLFSICAQAQAAAAAGAVEAATGHMPGHGVLAAREAAVVLETIQEYLWRILLDWPLAMGHPAPTGAVAAARGLIAPVLARAASLREPAAEDLPDRWAGVPREVASGLETFVTEQVYGTSPAAWLAQDDSGADALAAWAASARTLPARLFGELCATAPALGASDVALMPAPRRESLLAAVVPAMRSTDGFECAPRWQGVPVETGALARLKAHPLVAAALARYGNAVPARMAARLAELALLVTGLSGTVPTDAGSPWVEAFATGSGEGLGVVQTARGLLLHRVRVAGDRVSAYQIVAPTEWNFHPEGALVRGLEGGEARDETAAASAAHLVVQALDPCVACRIEVARA